MTEIAYFSDFIKQHRAELPSGESVSSFANEVAAHINTIASDYMRGDFAKWVDQLLEPNAHGITISRQEAVACIATLSAEKERIIGLTRLFAAEVAHYDQVFGRPSCVDQWDSTNAKTQRASFLVGMAIGSAPDFYEQETPPAYKTEAKQKRWSIWQTIIVIEFLLNLYNTHQSNQPNPQLAELVDLQKQEIAIVQQIGEDTKEKMDQIGDWVISFGDAFTERTEAIAAQTDAIRENTQAIEQLTDKMEGAEGSLGEQETADETKPNCDCGCHDIP